MLKVKLLHPLLVFSSLLLLPLLLCGQHEMIIEPGPGVYINEVIEADTTAGGDRVDLDRVYVLRRGETGIYFVNYRVEANGFDVRVKAEDGSGQRPVIYSTTNTVSGNYPGEQFRIDGEGGNVYLNDLIMVGYLESLAGEIDNIPSGLLRVQTAGFDIVIDGCILSNTRGQIIRTQGACRVVKITNSIFANMGDLGRSNLGAGKGIDLRDTSCDTLLMVNNTFVNFQDRIIRHRSSTAALNHLIFDHNTIVNGFSFHGTLALGWVGDDVQITNNLLIDPFIAGNDTDATRQAEFDESGELDAYGFGRMNWIFTVPNDTTEFTISNNYYSISSEVQEFYDSVTDPVFTGEGAPLTWHINGKLGADSVNAFIKEDIELKNTVTPMVNLGVWYRTPIGEGGAGKTKATDNFVREDDDFDRRVWQYFADTLDCGYPENTAAATGSTTGGQVGDLNWTLVPTAIPENKNNILEDFHLAQNYPNPFNPSTTIKFSINKADKVKLVIYNIAGQRIATLVDKKMNAGSYEVEWNAAHVASGVYFYKLYFGTNTITKKMVLIQ